MADDNLVDDERFTLPIRYEKNTDNLSEEAAGSIIDGGIDGGREGYYLARIWNDGVSNPDEFAELAVRSVNQSAGVDALVDAGKAALHSLEVLAKIDADNTGVDVATCEYKGTKELRDALAQVDRLKGEG